MRQVVGAPSSRDWLLIDWRNGVTLYGYVKYVIIKEAGSFSPRPVVVYTPPLFWRVRIAILF